MNSDDRETGAVEADRWDDAARDAEFRDAEFRDAESHAAESPAADPGVTAPEAVEADAEPTTADAGPPETGPGTGFGTDHGTGRPAEHQDLPATPAADGDPLIAPDQEHRFLERWSHAQIAFVDDPHRAVDEAEALLEEIVAAQRTALEARRSEMTEQCHASTADTEDLRLAMRGYGQLVSTLLAHTG